MKVLYIHQYFKTPEEGGAIRSWYIASDMVRAGYEVEMITAYNGRSYQYKNIEGIAVHYLPVKYDNSYSFIRRIFSFLLFAHHAYYFSRKIEDVDFAYITSTPLTVGLVALRLFSIDKIPYVFEVRDLWPEAPIQLGALKNPLIKYLARSLEKRIYRKAKLIIALSPGIQAYVNQLFPEKPVHLCPNIADCDFFEMDQDKLLSIQEKYDLERKFIISYFGAIGWANELEYLLDLVRRIEKKGLNIHTFIIGDGARKEKLMQEVTERGIKSIDFIDHVNKYELKKYLSVIDAAYISFAGFPVLENNSPNKFFDALASGKLVISNVKGWIKDLIEEHQCGFYYDPEKPEEGLEKLQMIIRNSALLEKNKVNARHLAITRFERGRLVSSLLQFISRSFRKN